MKKVILIIIILLSITESEAQEVDSISSDSILMTIRGFNYLKSDSMTSGAYLNNSEILDTIANYLIANPNINIELHYHASCRSSSKAYWDNYTNRKSSGCKYYIVSKGVDEKRITSLGKGFSELIVDCICGECSLEELNTNQRLEVVRIK